MLVGNALTLDEGLGPAPSECRRGLGRHGGEPEEGDGGAGDGQEAGYCRDEQASVSLLAG